MFKIGAGLESATSRYIEGSWFIRLDIHTVIKSVRLVIEGVVRYKRLDLQTDLPGIRGTKSRCKGDEHKLGPNDPITKGTVQLEVLRSR